MWFIIYEWFISQCSCVNALNKWKLKIPVLPNTNEVSICYFSLSLFLCISFVFLFCFLLCHYLSRALSISAASSLSLYLFASRPLSSCIFAIIHRMSCARKKRRYCWCYFFLRKQIRCYVLLRVLRKFPQNKQKPPLLNWTQQIFLYMLIRPFCYFTCV